MCEICELESEEVVNIESFHVCKECAEDLELKESEVDSSEKCAVCGWPINRRISKEISKKFVEGVKEWLKNKCSKEILEKIEKRLSFLEGKDVSLCRYDFFSLIKKVLEEEDEKLGKEFENILKAFDFGGSLVS